MLDYAHLLIFQWKTVIELPGKLNSSLSVLHEYQDARLGGKIEGFTNEALVGSPVFYATNTLHSIDGIGAIRG